MSCDAFWNTVPHRIQKQCWRKVKKYSIYIFRPTVHTTATPMDMFPSCLLPQDSSLIRYNLNLLEPSWGSFLWHFSHQSHLAANLLHLCIYLLKRWAHILHKYDWTEFTLQLQNNLLTSSSLNIMLRSLT